MQKLGEQQLQASIIALGGWELEAGGGAILRNVHFADFREAFAFMTQVAMYAERIDHHPEWFNVYNQVNIRLNTHDLDGISELDITMAKYINNLLT